jgi:hypothetical protein
MQDDDQAITDFLARIDPARALLFGALYFFALLMLDISAWKAAGVGALIATCWMFQTGRRSMTKVGQLLIPYAVLVWIGAIPSPQETRAFVSEHLNMAISKLALRF